MKMVLATHNRDKVREISEVMSGLPVELSAAYDFPGAPEPEETGLTLEENAWIKASVLLGTTGLPALADDTGLFVEALRGAPGVRSARYAGESGNYRENVQKLMDEMRGVPVDRRAAAFRTVVAIAFPSEKPVYIRGEVLGEILEAPHGVGGFGYDPVFRPLESDVSFAEMSTAEKNRISHRGRAFRLVREWLESRLGSSKA
jgi:XTP/dITP diphosphohydrolase